MPEKKYFQVDLFIRSLIFSIYSIVSLCLYSFIMLLTFMLPLKKRHIAIRAYLRSYIWVLAKVCRINYEVHGLENIPSDRNGVFLSKHQSTWETFYLPLIFRDATPIAKRELLWIPFFGWAFAAAQPITIDRSNKSSAMQQIISKGKKHLEEGHWIMVFPEGTRVLPGEVGQYKLGGARLAVATGYPVVPVAHNAGCFWPKRRFIKQPGTIQVVVGPLIESKDRTAEEVLELAKQWIESTMHRLDSGCVNESTR